MKGADLSTNSAVSQRPAKETTKRTRADASAAEGSFSKNFRLDEHLFDTKKAEREDAFGHRSRPSSCRRRRPIGEIDRTAESGRWRALDFGRRRDQEADRKDSGTAAAEGSGGGHRAFPVRSVYESGVRVCCTRTPSESIAGGTGLSMDGIGAFDLMPRGAMCRVPLSRRRTCGTTERAQCIRYIKVKEANKGMH